MDAGMDASVNCFTVPLSPEWGSLEVVDGGLSVVAVGALPEGATRAAWSEGGLLGLFNSDRQVARLGTLPTLARGATLGTIVALDAGGFVSGVLATDGRRAYAAWDAPFGRGAPGRVLAAALDGGESVVLEATFTATAGEVPGAVLLNGFGVGPFARDGGLGYYLVSSEDGGVAVEKVLAFSPTLGPPDGGSFFSGATAVTGNGVLLAGVCVGVGLCTNQVRLVAAPRRGDALREVGLDDPLLFSDNLVNGVGAAGDTIFLSYGPELFSSIITRVDRLEVTRAPDGGFTVSAPRTVLRASDVCNRVLFFSPGPAGTVLLGRSDRGGAGRYVVQVRP